MLAHAARGDADATTRSLEALDACPGPPGAVGPDADQARAWALLVQGQIGACRARLLEAADLACQWNQLPAESAILHDLARIGFAADVVERLTKLTERYDGVLGPLRRDHTVALAHDDAEGLEAAARGFAAMGAMLLAAEAATQAAAAWRRAGQPRRATLCERSAQAHGSTYPGATTPALAAPTVQAILTPRERQIARLASQGLASKAIGLDVGLSSRTVDNYLQRIFDKLGVHRREELVVALTRSRADE